jgi:hypothetical protein
MKIEEIAARVALDPMDKSAAQDLIRAWERLSIINSMIIYQVVMTSTNQPWDSDLTIVGLSTDLEKMKDLFMEEMEDCFEDQIDITIEEFRFQSEWTSSSGEKLLYSYVANHYCLRLFSIPVAS